MADSLGFTLWLEFEEVDRGNWNTKNEYANIQVYLDDGRKYGINVWTYDFLQTAINHDIEEGLSQKGLYIIPPDLLVKELTRDCIERTIATLLEIGDLEMTLNPSIVIWET